jgi:hypothetical protein
MWAANKVGCAHCQVGSSSGRPDPLVRDGHVPGRWGPRGTLVSQAPERCVGAVTKVIELSTSRIACTSVQKEKNN